MKRVIWFILLVVSVVYSQLTISNLDGVEEYTITFDSTIVGINSGQFTGGGFQADPATGQIDSDGLIVTGFTDGDLTFGASGLSGDFSRGVDSSSPSNGVTTGGIYGMEPTIGDFAMGVQPGGTDFTPGEIILRVVNSTGTTVTHMTVNYEVWVLNDKNRSNSFNFSHSPDNLTFSEEVDLDLVSPADADISPVWTVSNKAIWLENLSVADGASYYLKWSGADVGGSGSRDEFALDDISISIGTALDVGNSLIQNRIQLLQPYPNPFNPEVTIRFIIAESEYVQVSITDLHGRTIGKLYDGFRDQGNFKLVWNGTSFPSGIYFIILNTDSYSQIQKITLLK